MVYGLGLFLVEGARYLRSRNHRHSAVRDGIHGDNRLGGGGLCNKPDAGYKVLLGGRRSYGCAARGTRGPRVSVRAERKKE